MAVFGLSLPIAATFRLRRPTKQGKPNETNEKSLDFFGFPWSNLDFSMVTANPNKNLSLGLNASQTCLEIRQTRARVIWRRETRST
jgi:hypothetical protein